MPAQRRRTGAKKAAMSGIQLLDERQFAEEMTGKVEPYLAGIAQRGTLPSGLYYELYPLADAVGTIVISFGFTESALKFHEFIYYMLRSGFRCAVMDHRGHGLSIREGRYPNVVHIKRFNQYAEDLHGFVHDIVMPWAGGGPYYLFGHSMGGCIAARYLELYPADFDKAVLNSPMFAINTGALPGRLAVLICDLFILTGNADKKLFYQGDFNPNETLEGSCATSRARFDYYHEIRRNNKAYQTTAASYSWAKQAVLAGKKAGSRREASKVAVPVLLLQAENDTLVKSRPQEAFIARIKRGEIQKIPGSKHEIYRSENSVLKGYYDRLISFLKGGA